MNGFYHSSAWGFDTSVINKKEEAKRFLNSIGLQCCIIHICDYSEARAFFDADNTGNCFLVIAIDKRSLKYTGCFDITSFGQLQNFVTSIIVRNNFSIERIKCLFINQMHWCPGCFTANIISDGKGNAIIEFIEDTVDNRLLSSGGGYKLKPKKILFNDFEMVYCDEVSVLIKLWDSLKTCLFYRGYYECSYAMINDIKKVYFSYYSDKEIYQNISMDYFEHDALKYRCVYLSLTENILL